MPDDESPQPMPGGGWISGPCNGGGPQPDEPDMSTQRQAQPPTGPVEGSGPVGLASDRW